MLFYLKETTFTLGILTIVFNFLMQASRTTIDFWLRSQVTPNDTAFRALDEYFGGF